MGLPHAFYVEKKHPQLPPLPKQENNDAPVAHGIHLRQVAVGVACGADRVCRPLCRTFPAVAPSKVPSKKFRVWSAHCSDAIRGAFGVGSGGWRKSL
eukprot:gene11442-biopygen4857